jgi:hypothetical protein
MRQMECQAIYVRPVCLVYVVSCAERRRFGRNTAYTDCVCCKSNGQTIHHNGACVRAYVYRNAYREVPRFFSEPVSYSLPVATYLARYFIICY